MNLERREFSSGSYSDFVEMELNLERLILDKYAHSRTSTSEARDDAINYAKLELSIYKIQPVLDDEFEDNFNKDMVKLWEKAIEGAKNGDWSAMKTALQDYARSSYESSRNVESLRKLFPNSSGDENSEERADAFVNLISSL